MSGSEEKNYKLYFSNTQGGNYNLYQSAVSPEQAILYAASARNNNCKKWTVNAFCALSNVKIGRFKLEIEYIAKENGRIKPEIKIEPDSKESLAPTDNSNKTSKNPKKLQPKEVVLE